MAEEQVRKPLEFRISNNTHITLRYHRTKEDRSCSHVLPELLSGSSDSYHVFSSSNALGLGWLVTYEAASFTLAVFFFLRSPPERPSAILHLELSLDKVHLGHLQETFDRMTLQQDPPKPQETAVSRAHFCGEGGLVLSAGSFSVLATASRGARPLLSVEVEERQLELAFPPPAYCGPPREPPEPCRYCQDRTGTSGSR